ncbi:MAG: type II toxin-antitoxin system mRNA interferase toxin, RelE/StbE family [Patescibacteria group bacterium]|nr:type II toxin-antitoxin system mRNA interferase toxin, RelE/StbE family [Patescibacteria group bacterium]
MTTSSVKIEFTVSFNRRLKKLTPQVKNKFTNLIVLFSENPFHPRLKTHKLTGQLKNRYAFSITPNLKVIFKFIDNHQTALLISVGSHDQVYR